MNTAPIIVPTSYVVNSDGRSEVEKCLEGDYGLSDLLAKKLANEAFTEEDTARVTECIENRREASGKMMAWFLGVLVVGMIAFFIWASIDYRR